jgi:hypothetical protein
VSPQQVSVVVGAETTLVAELRAADGAVLSGRSVTWTSGNAQVASVTQGGVVRGVGAGVTTVTAASEGRSANATVTVTPPPAASVTVTPNPASVNQGASVQLTATARDAAGAALTGKTFAWSSSAPTVASVDQNGLVQGLLPGTANVSAAVDNVPGSAVVNVLVPPPVAVTQIAPATLVEGQTATLTGSGFAPTPAGNQVTIDGVAAQVTQASATTLQVVVPAFDCRPRRTAPVVVRVGPNSSAPRDHAVAPASFVSLAVGQQLVLQETTNRCLQFDASSAAERYVVGVQSVSQVVATLTGVTVTGVPGGVVTSPPLPVAELPLAGPAVSEQEMQEAERWHRHLEAAVAGYERERLFLQPLLDRPLASPPTPAPTVPGTVTEGQQITVRFPAFDGNTCTQFTDLTVRVREISARAIFLEDVANPAQLAQSVYDQAALDFAPLFDIDVDHFGAPGDMDANERVVIVVTREVNRLQSPPLGFVAHSNLFPVAQCVASNEGEFFFMRTADATGQFTAGVYTEATLARDLPMLLVHEFAHVIQGSRRRAAGGQFMASWLAEGLATAAQEVAGFQLLNLSNGQNYGRTRVYSTLGADPRGFFSYMGDLLAYFGFDFNGGKRAGAPEECSWVGSTGANGNPGPCAFATRLLYGVPWTLIKNAIDRHHGGAAGQKQILRAFSDRVGPPGFADLEAVLGRPITSLVVEWAPVLYLDDRYPAAGFQMANWNVRDIAAAWNNVNAELTPRARPFGAFSDAFNVRAGSAAYHELSGQSRPPTSVRFRDAAGAALPEFVVVWVVRVQ